MKFISDKEKLLKILQKHIYQPELRLLRHLERYKPGKYRRRMVKALVKKLARKNIFLSPDLVEELLTGGGE